LEVGIPPIVKIVKYRSIRIAIQGRVLHVIPAQLFQSANKVPFKKIPEPAKEMATPTIARVIRNAIHKAVYAINLHSQENFECICLTPFSGAVT